MRTSVRERLVAPSSWSCPCCQSCAPSRSSGGSSPHAAPRRLASAGRRSSWSSRAGPSRAGSHRRRARPLRQTADGRAPHAAAGASARVAGNGRRLSARPNECVAAAPARRRPRPMAQPPARAEPRSGTRTRQPHPASRRRCRPALAPRNPVRRLRSARRAPRLREGDGRLAGAHDRQAAIEPRRPRAPFRVHVLERPRGVRPPGGHRRPLREVVRDLYEVVHGCRPVKGDPDRPVASRTIPPAERSRPDGSPPPPARLARRRPGAQQRGGTATNSDVRWTTDGASAVPPKSAITPQP